MEFIEAWYVHSLIRESWKVQIKVYVENPTEVEIYPSLNLYDALDTAREFLDLGCLVEIDINGMLFRMLKDGPYLRAIPQPKDSSPSAVRNPNLSTENKPGDTIA